MKALTIEQGSQTRFVDIAEPVCGKGEVLLNVERVGLCGSDLNTWRGQSSRGTGWLCFHARNVVCAVPV